VAALIALAAFVLYRSTLLPGLELGDSASFQTMAGSPVLTPRDGYPLYYAIAALFVPLFDSDAYAMNALSAVESALACGVVVVVAAELSGSVIAAAAAALLFAGSYTFWSQAVIAEVYGLHLLLVAVSMLLLLRWSRQPSQARLVAFFAVYALAFGNHLSMILLAPAYTAFLLLTAPGGWRSMVRPTVVAAALACAAAGALQYAWNLRALWLFPEPPHGVGDALAAFWFDVTKSDWRDTMVLRVPPVMAGERLRMYLFDLHQQFGWAPVVLAVAGFAQLARHDARRALLVGGLFAVTLAFALGYNVGDTHVFLLPSHLMIALLAAVGITAASKKLVLLFGVLVVALAAAHIYRDFPALDRSSDTRPATLLAELTEGLHDHNAILLTDLNWQVQNGLSYYGDKVRPELGYVRLAEVLLYAPALIRDNRAIGRDVVLTDRARVQLAAAYGPLVSTAPDERGVVDTLRDTVSRLPRGTPYVLCVLKPSREFTVDPTALDQAIATLTGQDAWARAGQDARARTGQDARAEARAYEWPPDDYFVIAGLAGEPPQLADSSMTPFRRRLTLAGLDVQIRMESVLAFDTIRRMGFGHVIANRHHALIIERGVSFAALDENGRAGSVVYEAGIFAAQPRHRVLSSN
jgi:hypothetical protein